MIGERASERGFTLTELMIVTTVLSLLAMIALPKFGNLVLKSKEAAIKGQLGGLRSAMSIYYSDNEGQFPVHPFYGLTNGGKYMNSIPQVAMPAVPWENNPGHIVHYYDPTMFHLENAPPPYPNDPPHVTDRFHWRYTAAGPDMGTIAVECFDKDSTGVVWSTY